jgi:dihydrofolate reductase
MRNENMSQPNIRLSLLVAADEANVIGKDNRLPWHLPSDLKYFKNLTWGMPVAMGRKTFESIGKPLPGRTNIVITRNRAWVIGGAEIFEMALPQASRIYLTRIHHRFEGDVFFPKLSPAEWHLAKSHRHEPDAKNLYAHTFEEWERQAAVQE